ncbi:hypothetical protein [Lentimicrobium sp.]|uniref:hypothetical protein n=1 Tax=Lentimicrobium sp. TaxID=2034841 RepID=UPI002C1868D4|nr:hypothetical protein [Lentimicrobium sp.]HPF65766.1 hypothetical protein [Lentimicrobium sp.]
MPEAKEPALVIIKASGIDRFQESLHRKAIGEGIKNLPKSQWLVLKTSEQPYALNTRNIIRIPADGNYCTF